MAHIYHTLNFIHKLAFILFIGISIMSCSSANRQELQLLDLAHKEADLKCNLSEMKEQITEAWDEINQLLEEKLPEEMPAEEKRNMLNVRNASLIRMFQSYADVDENIKKELDKTEKMDMKMSKEIVKLNQEMEKIETLKLGLLNKLEEAKGEQGIASINNLYQNILNEDCRH